MSDILAETSVLVRLSNSADSHHPNAVRAILTLHRQGHVLRTTPQVLIEYRSVATRPLDVNGLGLSPADSEVLAAGFESAFPLLPETPDIYPAWKALTQAEGAIGKQVHDARLAAICHVYGVTQILTFNVRHFTRFSGYGPGLTVLDASSF